MIRPELLPLQEFRIDFCDIVSNHIRHHLNPSEWGHLLALAQSGVPHSPELSFTAFDSIEGRVQHLTFVEQISPQEMQSVPEFCQHVQTIGLLRGQPVCYFQGSGLYQWSFAPDADSLCFWLSYPVYPPGWPSADTEQTQSKVPHDHFFFKPTEFI